MNKFLAGLMIGLPIGMLLGDHWEDIAGRLRREIRRDLRGVTEEGGRDLAEAVNRIAESAREAASEEREGAMLNQVAREELLAVYGIGPTLTQRILDGRPYRRNHEVVEKGIINERTFEQLRRQVLVKHRNTA